MTRALTHTQYEALRDYPPHTLRWVLGGQPASLVRGGYIAPATHDRSMYQLTAVGAAALESYRARWGVTR